MAHFPPLRALTNSRNPVLFTSLMHKCTAPAGRGQRQLQTQKRARQSGLPALLCLTFIILTTAVLVSPSGLAEMPDASTSQRQLQAVSGTASPLLALSDLHGSLLDLEQVAGKVILVHFFATWCEPCRQELASLSELVEQDSGGHLAVLAVSVAEIPVRLKRFFETQPVNFPVLLDTDRTATKTWGVSMLPTTFVLDRRGAVRLQVEGDLDWQRPRRAGTSRRRGHKRFQLKLNTN